MPRYPNGRVPDAALVTFATGWLPNEGTWKHQLPPATYRKHLALVALALRNTGRLLKPTEGWSCYRPLSVQEYAKRIHGIWAATPGTSSHGMFWEGRDCAAIDYGNWSYVYGGDRGAFYRDVRAVGLAPGLIAPARGYPDEPWHVVDLEPWAAVPASSGGAPTANHDTKEFPMFDALYVKQTDGQRPDKDRIFAIFRDPRTGQLVKDHITNGPLWAAIEWGLKRRGVSITSEGMKAADLDKIPTWKNT